MLYGYTTGASMRVLLIILLFAVTFAGGGYVFLNHFPQKPSPTVVMADEQVVLTSKGGLLEVSRIEATETFEKAQVHSIFGVSLPGPTITQIRVPVTYRYHVELDPDWKFIRSGKTFIAIAPPVKPSLPVAFNTSGMQAYANGVWSIFTGGNSIQKLQKTMTPVLADRALSSKYLDLQREYARKTVTEFVSKWVVSQERWKAGGYDVKVFFSDEPLNAVRKSGLFPVPLAGS